MPRNFEPIMFIPQANTEKKTNERAKGPKAWIREGTEEEPVDFLDPGVVQRVVGKLRLHKSLENPFFVQNMVYLLCLVTPRSVFCFSLDDVSF